MKIPGLKMNHLTIDAVFPRLETLRKKNYGKRKKNKV